MTSVLIVGCGYMGGRVAKAELATGAYVAGVVRSGASAQRLHATGIRPIVADLDVPTLPPLPAAGAVVYYFVPPPPRGVTDPRAAAFTAMLDGGAPPPRRVVLISTTGVYGDCAGEWVTEDREARPRADRARRRLAAETTLRQWGRARGVPVVILRVPGIYGPGRLPERRLRAGEPVLREAESPYSNRIHADDLARACVAAARRGRPDRIYNVSDGHPTTMTDYFYRVADVLGLPRPPAVSLAEARASMSAAMVSYLEESKRLDNRRMREELGVEPLYPDLESGLRACRDADTRPAERGSGGGDNHRHRE